MVGVVFWIAVTLLNMAFCDLRSQSLNDSPHDTSSSINDNRRLLSIFSDEKTTNSGGTKSVPSLMTNPFISDACKDSFDDKIFELNTITSMGVVIPVRNEDKATLLHTVQSIITNSEKTLLKSITIVDDMSDSSINQWPEWESLGNLIKVVVPPHRMGVAGAKDFGAQLLQGTVDVMVFVDAHVVVSENWLSPLAHVIEGYPSAIVYPSIDIIDPETGSFAKADNVVGGFTWGLGFRWEALSSDRLSSDSTGKSEDDVVTSPAAPGMFAIKSSYYRDIGGLDVALQPWGQESIELSIRVWLCGGIVVRQSCSRVAHRYDNLFRKVAASKGNGISQMNIDRNVMSIAEHWMKPAYREIVHAARFTGRIPYTVQLDLDVKQPQRFNVHAPLGDSNCASFDWFLKEIYPGLLRDIPGVEERYKVHLESSYLQQLLAPWVKMYQSKAPPVPADAVTQAELDKRSNAPEELAIQAVHDSLIPQPVYSPLKDGTKRGLAKRVNIKIEKSPEKDPHERHANYVRETLSCEDEKDVPHSLPCPKLALNTNGCTGNRYYMMFGCPKSCGLCGIDGKICFDFYEHKCPEYKKEGRCEAEDEKDQMMHDCRLSCGHCTPASKAEKAIHAAEPIHIDLQDHNAHHVIPAALANGATVAGLNHRRAQEEYQQGLLPDVPGSNPCALNGLPHGLLLARISIADPVTAPDVRVFCALYTMEKNHGTNVKAVKETWGKRCDGFVAFSTVSDPAIPAYKIEHEGDEAYDNMWQKSRSIWKFIAKNYASEFDYFLIGGDDMFYIIENLKAYLNSQEVRELRAKGTGVFLGRRFFPPKQNVFNSGGAGYLVDQAALAVLGAHLDSPECFPHQRGFWEDVNIANCLRVNGAILPYDTRDPLERERFHPFTPGQHLEYRKPEGQGDWYPKYNPYLKEGYDCCSSESISFHYVPGELLYKLHGYHHHCDRKLVQK